MNESDLIGKTIKAIDIDGYGLLITFSDGTILEYDASDGGYSCWGITEPGKEYEE